MKVIHRTKTGEEGRRFRRRNPVDGSGVEHIQVQRRRINQRSKRKNLRGRLEVYRHPHLNNFTFIILYCEELEG